MTELPGRARLLDPELRAEIAAASPGRRRSIAIAVARMALAPHGALAAKLDSALLQAEAMGRADPELQATVMAAAQHLDDRYLDLYDDEKPGGRSEGWEGASRLARAAAAASFALDPDPTVAAIEASYEAWHALDEDPRVRRVVRDAG